MIIINKEIYKFDRDLAIVKRLLKSYAIFLEDPHAGLKAVKGISDGKHDEEFDNINKGLNGEFTKSKSVEVGISIFRDHITNHISALKEGVKKNNELINKALEDVKKNNTVAVGTMPDSSLLNNIKNIMTKDLVCKEYAEHKINALIGTLLGNENNRGDSIEVLLKKLSNKIGKLNAYNKIELQTKTMYIRNMLKVINLRLENKSIDIELKLPNTKLKEENISKTLADSINSSKATSDDISIFKSIDDIVTNIPYMQTRVEHAINDILNEVNAKDDTVINKVLDKVIAIANNTGYTTNELEIDISYISKLLEDILVINKAYTIYLLNSFIDINNSIREESKYMNAVEKIMTESIFIAPTS